MLRITVELYPGGATRYAKRLATLDIANISERTEDGSLPLISDYKCWMHENDAPYLNIDERSVHFILKQQPRNVSVWALVAEAIMRWQNPDIKDE